MKLVCKMLTLFQDVIMIFISVNYLPLLLTLEFIYMISVNYLININKCLILQNVSAFFPACAEFEKYR
jgi:hypothetical protein